jgi:splicing factor 45
MATPLVAQKTAANAGVIVNADQPADKRARVGATFVGTPCRVVVLRNMVGPGEVDADLEEEVCVTNMSLMCVLLTCHLTCHVWAAV